MQGHARFRRLFETSQWGLRVKQLLLTFNELRERPSYLLSALALSILNHVFWCASLICITRAVGYSVSFVQGFAVFPLAIFGNVFGVAGGFGVGTAVFDLVLSQLMGVSNGALIGLLFQTLSAIARLARLPFYLNFRLANGYSADTAKQAKLSRATDEQSATVWETRAGWQSSNNQSDLLNSSRNIE